MSQVHTILEGDVFDGLEAIPDESIQTGCSSPPYLWMRDYGSGLKEIGLEDSPDEYVATMTRLMKLVYRKLRKDGTFFLNLGDGYAGSGKGPTGFNGLGDQEKRQGFINKKQKLSGLKNKDLIGIPWRVVFALQGFAVVPIPQIAALCEAINSKDFPALDAFAAGFKLWEELNSTEWFWHRCDVIWCLSGGTNLYVKSQKGVMPMTVKDLARLNLEKVQLWNGEKWTNIKGMYKSEGDKPLNIVLRSGERIGCTQEHVFPLIDGSLKKASELKKGDILKSCRLPDQEENIAKLPAELIGWFVGMYLAEGSKGHGKTTLQFTGHVKETERFKKLSKIASAYHGTCRLHKTGGNTVTVNIYSKILSGIIDTYLLGNTAKNKHLTNKCWMRSNKFLYNLLMGYLEGDGNYDAKNQRWRLGFTRNYSLERDLRTICARLGLELTLNLSMVKFRNKIFPSFRGEIRENISNHHSHKNRSEIIKIQNSRGRKFWDIEVEDEPHIFSLASGILTHNSKPNCMPESISDRPTRSHEFIFMLARSGSPLFWTHRDLPGTKIRPKPDYRYLDLVENKEFVEKPEGFDTKAKEICPQCGGSGIVVDPLFGCDTVCNFCRGKGKIKRWQRINLWAGHDYFFDSDAIRTTHTEKSYSVGTTPYKGEGTESNGGKFNKWLEETGNGRQLNPLGAKRRDVWVIAPAQCKDVHFATFPPEIPRLAILAGSSEFGCCPICGAPYTRVIEKGSPIEEWKRICGADSDGGYNGISWKAEKLAHGKTGHFHRLEEFGMKMDQAGSHPPGTIPNNLHRKQDMLGKANYTGFNDRCREKLQAQNASDAKRNILSGMVERKTIGWRPTCDCGAGTAVPCTVLDMFAGTGTTGKVAKDLGRSSYLIELNPEYVKMIKKNLKIDETQLTETPIYRFLKV